MQADCTGPPVVQVPPLEPPAQALQVGRWEGRKQNGRGKLGQSQTAPGARGGPARWPCTWADTASSMVNDGR